jgi:hypothetical protein
MLADHVQDQHGWHHNLRIMSSQISQIWLRQTLQHIVGAWDRDERPPYYPYAAGNGRGTHRPQPRNITQKSCERPIGRNARLRLRPTTDAQTTAEE